LLREIKTLRNHCLLKIKPRIHFCASVIVYEFR